MDNLTLQRNIYFRVALFATILALCVIMLGAFTRLKDAGLGCPDWPGCFGQITVPHTKAEITKAEKLYPGDAVQPAKAWAEMVHRYFAGTLGLIIFGLAFWALIRRAAGKNQNLVLPALLVVLVIFQAALGMWTVTWQLLPLVVMGHLLGGMTIAALLWALTLVMGRLFTVETPYRGMRPWAIIGLLIVIGQIFLGGWTTANYASLACLQFPFCNGTLFPHFEFQKAFSFISPIGTNYQGGDLDVAARVTIQMMHRYWGLVTGLYIGILAICMIAAKPQYGLRALGWILLILLLAQITLGIMNIELLLPIEVAVAHNGGAALLLLSMVTLLYKLFAQPRSIAWQR